MTLKILGTEYIVEAHDYPDDPVFERESALGYCTPLSQTIVICNLATCKGWKNESEAVRTAEQKLILQHEIVHAFFAESGLDADAANYTGAWPLFEENIDWIARQGPKIYQAWKDAGAL